MTAANDLRIALDTSILTSAEGLHGDGKKAVARRLLLKLPTESTVLPVHTLGELCYALVRKAGRSRENARTAVMNWHNAFRVVGTSQDIMRGAADLMTVHEVNIWEAVILETAARSNCRLLLSEDFEEGFHWGGVTVTNPFSERRHPLLDRLLRDPDRH
jgi:predicted nucleic acid-binding protein